MTKRMSTLSPGRNPYLPSPWLLAVTLALASFALHAQVVTKRVVTPIDLNGDGRFDFNTVETVSLFNNPSPPAIVEQKAWELVPVDPASAWLVTQSFAGLPAGTTIDPQSTNDRQWYKETLLLLVVVSTQGSGTGGILARGPGFIGVRFPAADGEHFGWLTYESSNQGEVRVAQTGQVSQSRAGYPIGAGEVPLAIERTAAELRVSWPASAANFILEAATSPNPVEWTRVEGVNGNAVQLLATDPRRFFRLR